MYNCLGLRVRKFFFLPLSHSKKKEGAGYETRLEREIGASEQFYVLWKLFVTSILLFNVTALCVDGSYLQKNCLEVKAVKYRSNSVRKPM